MTNHGMIWDRDYLTFILKPIEGFKNFPFQSYVSFLLVQGRQISALVGSRKCPSCAEKSVEHKEFYFKYFEWEIVERVKRRHGDSTPEKAVKKHLMLKNLL